MINLLPPVEKEAITFARHNTQLRRWIVGALVGLVGVMVVIAFGQMQIQQNTNNYKQAIAAKEQRLEASRQKETLERVKGIQDSFKLVVDVLSREVLFSKLLPRVGAIMPNGTILADLSLNTEGEATAFDLTASAVSYQAASQIQANLQDPENKLFESADLVGISCATSDEPTQYPCEVQVRVQPAEENPFLLLADKEKKQ